MRSDDFRERVQILREHLHQTARTMENVPLFAHDGLSESAHFGLPRRLLRLGAWRLALCRFVWIAGVEHLYERFNSSDIRESIDH
jgi:hypothetical protein